MPCTSCGSYSRDYSEIKELKNAVCSLAIALEEAGVAVPKAALPMVEAHRNEDRIRKQIEAATKQKEAIKKSALSKLSREERDVLGLR